MLREDAEVGNLPLQKYEKSLTPEIWWTAGPPNNLEQGSGSLIYDQLFIKKIFPSYVMKMPPKPVAIVYYFIEKFFGLSGCPVKSIGIRMETKFLCSGDRLSATVCSKSVYANTCANSL